MKNIFFYAFILLMLSLSFFSCKKDDDGVQPTTSISTPTELTAALTEFYNQSDVPGFAVSVVKNDQIVYQETFGHSDIAANQAYTNPSAQPIGSISKTFIAAALVKAIEQGHFTLETDINDILPVELTNPKQPDAIIQIKHLVTHTSGLIDQQAAYFQAYHILPGEDVSTPGGQLLQNGFGLQQRAAIPLEEFLAAYYLEDGDFYSLDNFAPTTPGSVWQYSNIASSLTAYLIEAATGTPFKEYVKTQILEPLGMTNTAYDQADLDPAHLTKLYWDRDTPLPAYNNDSYPDGNLISCNEDLAKYLLDMMKGAKGESTTLFSKEGYGLLFSALLPNGVTPANLGENQGIFWVLEDGDIKHDGSDPGTTCNLQFDTNGELGYVLLTNMDASTDEHEIAWYQLSGKIHNAIVAFLNAE